MKEIIKIHKAFLFYFIFTSSMFYTSSCKKFVEVGSPKTALTTANVFTSDATATSTMMGIYSTMVKSGFASGDISSITYLSGLSSDELSIKSLSGDRVQFFNNGLSSSNFTLGQNLWSLPYQCIYTANSIVEGLSKTNGVSQTVKKQLIGEAEFTRAFCYFYLVNLFGDIPFTTTTDYTINKSLPRVKQAKVYTQIVADLQDAINLLAADFSFSNGERVRPNKWAAMALLARVYLYKGDWANAEQQATNVISNSSMFSLCNNLNNVFLKNSTETIWQLMPVNPNINTNEGSIFILTGNPTNSVISPQLLNAFENGDLRKSQWIDSIDYNNKIYYYPYKYKVHFAADLSEYSTVLRLSELYLIRSEARLQQGSVQSAQQDLNIIRNRAGLPNNNSSDKNSLLNAIEHERQVELFTEWGHRWLDLKRYNTVNSVMSVAKGSAWSSTAQLYPIPDGQIQNDINITQNPGY